MTSPASDSPYIRQAAYLDRRRAVCCRSITYFTIIVLSPRPDRAIVFQDQSMAVSSSNSQDVGQTAYLDGERAIYGCSIAQLSVVIVSPRPDATIVSDG